MSTDAFGASGSDAQQTLQSFWPRVMEEIRNLTVVGFHPGRYLYTPVVRYLSANTHILFNEI